MLGSRSWSWKGRRMTRAKSRCAIGECEDVHELREEGNVRGSGVEDNIKRDRRRTDSYRAKVGRVGPLVGEAASGRRSTSVGCCRRGRTSESGAQGQSIRALAACSASYTVLALDVALLALEPF